MTNGREEFESLFERMKNVGPSDSVDETIVQTGEEQDISIEATLKHIISMLTNIEETPGSVLVAWVTKENMVRSIVVGDPLLVMSGYLKLGERVTNMTKQMKERLRNGGI